jgi:hypothetical protein
LPCRGAILKSGSSSTQLQRRILDTAKRSKGAAGFCCRQLDGRAAILMVIARPGGCELAGSVRGSSARWSFMCLATQSHLSSSEGSQDTSRTRILSRQTLTLAPIPSAIGTARHLATPFNPQLTDGLSILAAFRRRDASENCVCSAYRVAARRPGAVQNRRSLARTPPGRPHARARGALEARDAAATRGRNVGSGKS